MRSDAEVRSKLPAAMEGLFGGQVTSLQKELQWEHPLKGRERGIFRICSRCFSSNVPEARGLYVVLIFGDTRFSRRIDPLPPDTLKSLLGTFFDFSEKVKIRTKKKNLFTSQMSNDQIKKF